MKICQWNIENLFILLDKYKGENLTEVTDREFQQFSISPFPNKHIQKVIDCAKVIKDIDADVYMLNEIGGSESLINFNKYFLGDEYDCYITNSRDRIDNGFLVKKKYKAKYKKYRNIKRGISELKINGLTLLLVHLKSKRSSEKDYLGINQRTADLKKVFKRYEKGDILSGDFNMNISDPEFKNTVQESSINNLDDITMRATHVGFYPNRVLNELDHFFTTNKIKSYGRYLFKNDYGDILGLPDTFIERSFQPSDHFPIWIII